MFPRHVIWGDQMTEKNRILFLSANPWTTSRILVDEEAREIFERIQEGPYRDKFELHKHSATRTVDLQRLLLTYRPHIVHFSGHGSKKKRIILGGTPGRGRSVDQRGLADMFALYSGHVRLVLLNACFTKSQALSISQVIDYSVGTGRGIGDKGGVAFAGAFYRALGFGKSIQEAFHSAKAELGLTKMPRTQGIELFIRDGIKEEQFPRIAPEQDSSNVEMTPSFMIRSKMDCERTEIRSRIEISTYETTRTIRYSRRSWSEKTSGKHALRKPTNRKLVSSQK